MNTKKMLPTSPWIQRAVPSNYKFSILRKVEVSMKRTAPNARRLQAESRWRKFKKPTESNRLNHYFLKYLFLGLGIIMVFTSIVSWFFPKLFWFNGEQMERIILATLVFRLIGIVCFPIFITVKNKLDESGIPSLMQFIYPPLYKLKIKEDNKVYWFNTENKFIRASGFVKVLSEMGDLIQGTDRTQLALFPTCLDDSLDSPR